MVNQVSKNVMKRLNIQDEDWVLVTMLDNPHHIYISRHEDISLHPMHILRGFMKPKDWVI